MEKSTHQLQKLALGVTRWIGSPLSIFVHTALFITVIVLLFLNIFPFDVIILIFNTAVSLEAIYLALFIQMTVNYQGESLEEVGQDIDEIQEDIDEIQEDVGEIQEDVDEIQENVEEMTEPLPGMESFAEVSEENKTLSEIRASLEKLISKVDNLQNHNHTS